MNAQTSTLFGLNWRTVKFRPFKPYVEAARLSVRRYENFALHTPSLRATPLARGDFNPTQPKSPLPRGVPDRAGCVGYRT